jgi:hypothetical protein
MGNLSFDRIVEKVKLAKHGYPGKLAIHLRFFGIGK